MKVVMEEKNTNVENENTQNKKIESDNTENKDMANVYSEVIAVLKIMDDDEKLEKLPMEFVELLKNKSNPGYEPKISKDKPIEEQNLKNETYGLIAWIAQKYWHEKIFEKVYVENDIDLDILQYLEDNKDLPILYEDLNWYEKIKIKIIKFIDKVFKRNKTKAN